MRALIDTIFSPVLNWLNQIYNTLQELIVPVSRPLNVGRYFGPLAEMGPYWVTFITTVCTLAFVYMVVFLVVSYQGAFIRFKDMIKWW